MVHRQRRAAWAIGMLLGTALIGCGTTHSEGPERVAVTGTVTLDGQPLENGVIRFIPHPGVKGPRASMSVTAGRFEFPASAGPVPGPHRVEIEPGDPGGIAPDDEAALEELAAGKRKLAKPIRIPAIYNVRSTLQRTIQADSPNDFEFPLVTRR